MYSIWVLYSRLRNKIIKIVDNLKIQTSHPYKTIFKFLLGSPLLCSLFFSVHYFLKIISLSINDPEFIIYSKIILMIFKNSSKYFLFLTLGVMLCALSEKKLEKENFNDDYEDTIKTKSKK